MFSSSFAYGEYNNDEILVIGSGKNTKGNLAEARKQAISDAYVKGIEAYLEKTLGSKGMINNFKIIINEIIPGSADIIENFRELAIDDSDKSYKMLVSIKINQRLMDERLRKTGIIQYEGVPISVLFLVSERIAPDEFPSVWWDDPEKETSLSSTELLFYRLFQERGFDPVNRLNNMPENGYKPELFKPELTDEEAVQWGKLYSTEVVITGKVEKNYSGITAADFRAIDVEGGSVIASYAFTQNPATYQETAGMAEDITDRILDNGVTALISDILKSFKKGGEKKSNFDIVLKDLNNLKQVMDFISFIKTKISGVVTVLPSRITQGAISFSIEYSGERKMFIDKIRNSNEAPFTFEIGIDEADILIITSM